MNAWFGAKLPNLMPANITTYTILNNYKSDYKSRLKALAPFSSSYDGAWAEWPVHLEVSQISFPIIHHSGHSVSSFTHSLSSFTGSFHNNCNTSSYATKSLATILLSSPSPVELTFPLDLDMFQFKEMYFDSSNMCSYHFRCSCNIGIIYPPAYRFIA